MEETGKWIGNDENVNSVYTVMFDKKKVYKENYYKNNHCWLNKTQNQDIVKYIKF